MAEELQNLINRIQHEGVEKARAESEQIISEAKAKAAKIIQSAEANAQDIKKKAETSSKVYTERSTRTLEHAARDVLISVGHGVENLFKDIITKSLNEALSPEQLVKMILSLIQAYAAHGMAESRLEVLVSPKDQEKVKALYLKKYSKALEKGIKIRADDKIIKGFKLTLKDGQVYHDFTQEAIAEAFAALIRPELSKIVYRVASKQVKQGGDRTIGRSA